MKPEDIEYKGKKILKLYFKNKIQLKLKPKLFNQIKKKIAFENPNQAF